MNQIMKTKFFESPFRSLMMTLLSVFALALTTSCDKDDEDDAKTITQIVVDGADFTLLEAGSSTCRIGQARWPAGSLIVFLRQPMPRSGQRDLQMLRPSTARQ